MISWMPEEIVVNILSHLDFESLQSAHQVCTTWSRLIEQDDTTVAINFQDMWHDWSRSHPITGPPHLVGATDASSTTVWSERVRRDLAKWMPLIPRQCDYRWLCRVVDMHGVRSLEQWGTSGLYVGDLDENGEPHGWGIHVTAPEGPQGPQGPVVPLGPSVYDSYSGQWKNGLQHGWGRMVWNGGRTHYEGYLKQGQRYGHGTYEWEPGKRYTGFHVCDQLDGYGVFKSHQSTIAGNWRRNQQHGKSLIQWPPEEPTGWFYGEYERGRRVGFGSYHWSDGAVYHGNWQGTARHGQGLMHFANGVVYEGDFADDYRHGEGVLRWPDGSHFQGRWERGARRGPGSFFDAHTRQTHHQQWTAANEAENVQYHTHAAKYPTGLAR